MLTTRLRWWTPIALWLGCVARAQAGPPEVPADFDVRLVAYVPAIHFPSQVATAPGGELFIAEDPMDQVGPYESKGGKILLYRDGKPLQVFAEGFRAIFGMTWHDGSLYVSHMPYLTVLRDADGDGVAESRRDLFRDLGITDNRGLNDHIVSGLQFGIDGRLYIAVGDKGVPRATGPDGRTAQLRGGGTLRCRADGTEIEVFTTGTRNHLEPNLDAQDNLFTYDNTDDGDGWWTRVTHHVDGGYYGYPYDYHARPDRFLDRMAEYGGGSPCGGLVYREDAWPERYRGRVLWAEWGKRKVQAFRVEPAGASFRVEDVVDLAQVGTAGNFHPIDLALSYDGRTLYVADWGMGGWGSKTEQVGTVFAITYKGPAAAAATRPRGSDADPLDAQFRQLDHPSYNERTRAQAAIIRAGRPALARAVALLGDESVDPIARRHLVWVVDACAADPADATAAAALEAACTAGVADVRAQAARALGERRQRSAIAPLIAALGDASPPVRLQAIVALGRIGDPRAVPPLLPLAADLDRTLAFATRQALRRIGAWDAVARGLEGADSPRRAAILATLDQVAEPGAVAALGSVVADPAAPGDERARALAEMALVVRRAPPWDGKWWGTRPTQGKPPARTVAWESTPAILRAIEAGLADPAPPVRLAAVAAVVEADDRAALAQLRARFAPGVEADPAVRAAVARALGAFKDGASVAPLRAAIDARADAGPVRAAAIAGLEAIGGDEAARALADLLTTRAYAFDAPGLIEVVAAVGRLPAPDAAAGLIMQLGHRDPAVRVAVAEAMGQLGPNAATAVTLRARLQDPVVAVRKAALAALGRIRDEESVAAILPFVADESTRFEATLALTRIPDLRALPVYLAALTDKSRDIRAGALAALGAIRDEAAPELDRLAARRELAPATLPELRKVYSPFRPVEGWHLVGPFPLDAAPPVPPGGPIDLGAGVARGDGAALAWKPGGGDAEAGAVDLAELFAPDVTKQSAFGVAEVESATARPARVMVGCDDRLTVWLNGEVVYRIEGSHTYAPDMAQFDVTLRAGANRLLVQSSNDGGPWKFSLAVTRPGDYAFLRAPAAGGFDPAQYRAVAARGRGRAEHGRELFRDLKGLACIKCHVAGGGDGDGGNIGPDLSGVATLYPRDELITSVLAPSARIFSGYETTVVATTDGRTIAGVVKGDTADGLELADADGKRTRIPAGSIEERRASDVSLMPAGIVEGIGPDDFADLIAYLETLKNAAANQGQPGGK